MLKENTSLLNQVIDQICENRTGFNREDALYLIHSSIHGLSNPFDFAKQYGVLVNNSAEDFMIEFMTAYNAEISPNTY